MKNLSNYKVKNKKILLRVDLNVPVVNGVIVDNSRIKSIKLTIDILKKQNNKIFLISHFGRPKGKVDQKYSLKFLCSILENELEIDNIIFLKNFDNDQIQLKLKKMKTTDICLFENIRFNLSEEINDLSFIKKICENFDIFINDAFSASHRKHASIVGPPNFLPSLAGESLINEIKNINIFFDNPKNPNLAIIGGSKISTKIGLLKNLIRFFDKIIIGGAMANTFFLAVNKSIGKSLCEKDFSSVALEILKQAKKYKCEIILPIDVVCAKSIEDKSLIKNYDIDKIPDNLMALDVGEKTILEITKIILDSKMILWNGPLGAFEYSPFSKSSLQIAGTINYYKKKLDISTIAGGGDTVAVINLAKANKGFDYMSNAGGAFLEWLEGNESPGVLALRKNKIV